MNAVDPRVAELEAENARLREKLADLEYAIGRRWHAPLCLKLPRREEMVLGALMASKAPIQVDRLYRYLYADDPDETPDIATVHSHVSKLRSKLKTRGVALRQMRNTGYLIESDGRRRVLDLFTEDVSSITIEVPTWVPDDLRVEYDRHARRFGEFYAARVIRRQIHPGTREFARA